MRNGHKEKNSNGFILMELILALSIFMIVSLPLLKFILHDSTFNVWKYIHNFSFINHQEIKYWFEDNKFPRFESATFQYLNFESSKNCDGVFDNLFMESISRVGLHTSNQQLFPTITYYKATSTLSSAFMFPTSLITDSYQDTAGDTHKSLIFGMDSSSTTDPDLLVVNEKALAAGSIISPQKYFFGPGIIDMVRDGTDVYAVERSLVEPIWQIPIKDLRNNVLNNDSSTFSNQNSGQLSKFAISSSTIKSAYPKKITTYKDYIIIGTEKNSAQEIYVFHKPVEYRQPDLTKILKIEVGAGINDITVNKNYLFLASPKNPELEIYNLTDFFNGNVELSISTTTYAAFDAPGSSGNGKVVSLIDQLIVLGRTIGNEELLGIRKKDGQFESRGAKDINQSVQKIVIAAAGRYLVILNKNLSKAIQIYAFKNEISSMQNPTDLHMISLEDFDLLGTISLDAIPTDIACTDKQMFISLQDSRIENRSLFAEIHFQ